MNTKRLVPLAAIACSLVFMTNLTYADKKGGGKAPRSAPSVKQNPISRGGNPRAAERSRPAPSVKQNSRPSAPPKVERSRPAPSVRSSPPAPRTRVNTNNSSGPKVTRSNNQNPQPRIERAKVIEPTRTPRATVQRNEKKPEIQKTGGPVQPRGNVVDLGGKNGGGKIVREARKQNPFGQNPPSLRTERSNKVDIGQGEPTVRPRTVREDNSPKDTPKIRNIDRQEKGDPPANSEKVDNNKRGDNNKEVKPNKDGGNSDAPDGPRLRNRDRNDSNEKQGRIITPGKNKVDTGSDSPKIEPRVRDRSNDPQIEGSKRGAKVLDLTKRKEGNERLQNAIDGLRENRDGPRLNRFRNGEGREGDRRIDIPQKREDYLPRLRLDVVKNGRTNGRNDRIVDRDHFANRQFQDRFRRGDLDRLVDSRFASRIDLRRQFDYHRHGDLARRLSLNIRIGERGGWRNRFVGRVSPNFVRFSHSSWYCGPRYYGRHSWYPRWSPWVDWCWWDRCDPWCDPRPVVCQPAVYQPVTVWNYHPYPTWETLPEVCGTWVDAAPVVVESMDLQLLAIRFVDPGHSEKELGPRFRLWIRNNSPQEVSDPFNVLLVAANSTELVDGLPHAGVRIDEPIRTGETRVVDIRLPFAASRLAVDSKGRKVPFTTLHAVVDSDNEITEVREENNGTAVPREEIHAVDPVLFASNEGSVASGSEILIAGEGLGPEPGQVIVQVGGLELEAEILGWYDLGVQVKLPELNLASDAAAEVVLIRGDGAASPPLTLELRSDRQQLALPPTPEEE